MKEHLKPVADYMLRILGYYDNIIAMSVTPDFGSGVYSVQYYTESPCIDPDIPPGFDRDWVVEVRMIEERHFPNSQYVLFRIPNGN